MSKIKDILANKIFTKYHVNLLVTIGLLVGPFLLIEHNIRYGGFEFMDFIGHEWYGAIITIVSIMAGFLNYPRENKK